MSYFVRFLLLCCTVALAIPTYANALNERDAVVSRQTGKLQIRVHYPITGNARVDADVADKVTEENLDSAVAFAKAFAAQTGAVVAITGAIDIVADAEKAYCIRNGNAMMSSITGTGCQLSALTAAFVTANPGHPLEAAAAAVCAMGLAGETAHKRLTPLDGNATYRNYIIDAIYNMTPDQLEEGANYEVR